jgi:type I restriction enzyme S subunit
MMIADLKPYPAYKDSGVPWLGNVPEHWTGLPGRSCFVERKIPNTGMVETTVLSLSYGRVVVKPVEKLHGLVPASFETYQIIDPDDIVIRPTDLQNDWNSLRFGFATTRGIITSAYLCFRTSQSVIPEFGHLLLHAYDLKVPHTNVCTVWGSGRSAIQ